MPATLPPPHPPHNRIARDCNHRGGIAGSSSTGTARARVRGCGISATSPTGFVPFRANGEVATDAPRLRALVDGYGLDHEDAWIGTLL
jgi:hypothetical protein